MQGQGFADLLTSLRAAFDDLAVSNGDSVPYQITVSFRFLRPHETPEVQRNSAGCGRCGCRQLRQFTSTTAGLRFDLLGSDGLRLRRLLVELCESSMEVYSDVLD